MHERAEISENDVVYDLYTGTGTIAQYIAKKAIKQNIIPSTDDNIKGVVENAVIPSKAYLNRRKGTIADLLTPNDSTFTNKIDVDKSLITMGADAIVSTVTNKRATGKVMISKTDITTSEPIKGAILQVIDKVTNEVVEEWTTTGEDHEIKSKSGTSFQSILVTSPKLGMSLPCSSPYAWMAEGSISE